MLLKSCLCWCQALMIQKGPILFLIPLVSHVNFKDPQQTGYLTLCQKPPAKWCFLGRSTCSRVDQDNLRGRSQHLRRVWLLTWEMNEGPLWHHKVLMPRISCFPASLKMHLLLLLLLKLWLEITAKRFSLNSTKPETQTMSFEGQISNQFYMTLNAAGSLQQSRPECLPRHLGDQDTPPLSVIRKNTQRKDEADASAASNVMKRSFCCYRDDIFLSGWLRWIIA